MPGQVTVTIDMLAFAADFAQKTAPTLAAVEQLINAMEALPPELRRVFARELSERLAAMAEGS